MTKQHVKHKIIKSLMSSSHRCVKGEEVFKIKCNGVCQARLVACGYNQVPGIDFSENYSALVNDFILMVLLLIMTMFHFWLKLLISKQPS